jgi:hypothetical protein
MTTIPPLSRKSLFTTLTNVKKNKLQTKHTIFYVFVDESNFKKTKGGIPLNNTFITFTAYTGQSIDIDKENIKYIKMKNKGTADKFIIKNDKIISGNLLSLKIPFQFSSIYFPSLTHSNTTKALYIIELPTPIPNLSMLIETPLICKQIEY